MRIYMGFRLNDACYVYSWDAQTPSRPVRLDPRLDLRSHSPSGFEWGYLGSGPTQLALALLADALRDDAQALAVYQHAKGALLSGLNRECWSITQDRVGMIAFEVERDLAVRRVQTAISPVSDTTGGLP
jgi:Family of unknown function (DUF6166)